MPRLIDADKTIGHIKTRLLETALNNATAVCDVAYIYQECADNRIETWIDEMPTVDAEPVKHGKWLDADDGIGCTCSICGYDAWADTPYCPHCGAKMDEERR